MWNCRVLTKWELDEDGRNSPVMPPMSTGCGWVDITGQSGEAILKSSPNAVVLQVLADDKLLAVLRADSAYTVLTTVSIDADVVATPTEKASAELSTAASRSDMAADLKSSGVPDDWIADCMKSGQTCEDVSDAIIAKLQGIKVPD